MANTEIKVRTGKNTLGACGILKSYKLNYKKERDIEGENTDFNGANKGDKITGKFTLLVGEFETVTINLGYGVSQFNSYKCFLLFFLYNCLYLLIVCKWLLSYLQHLLLLVIHQLPSLIIIQSFYFLKL